MKLGVLLLHCDDVASPRVTQLTRDWVHNAVEQVAAYLSDQSGRREEVRFRVFNWFKLPLSGQEWNALSFEAGHYVRQLVEQGLSVDLSPFDCLALVIDKPDELPAAIADDLKHIHIGAQSLSPTLLARQLVQLRGAPPDDLESTNGLVSFGGNFCVTGGESSKFSFYHSPLVSAADTPLHASSGPSMAAPSLLACGWLKLADHGFNLGQALASSNNRFNLELAPLNGAPGTATYPRVCAWVDASPSERILIEYRVRDERWNAGLPGGPSGEARWVVVHAMNRTGPPRSVQLGYIPAVYATKLRVERGGLEITVGSVYDSTVYMVCVGLR